MWPHTHRPRRQWALTLPRSPPSPNTQPPPVGARCLHRARNSPRGSLGKLAPPHQEPSGDIQRSRNWPDVPSAGGQPHRQSVRARPRVLRPCRHRLQPRSPASRSRRSMGSQSLLPQLLPTMSPVRQRQSRDCHGGLRPPRRRAHLLRGRRSRRHRSPCFPSAPGSPAGRSCAAARRPTWSLSMTVRRCPWTAPHISAWMSDA